MEIVNYPGHSPELTEGSVVTIGAFDGIHRGHLELLETVKDRAKQLGTKSVVVTFDRHPASVVRPESAPATLTDLAQKLVLLETAGIDVTMVIKFDEERSRETAEQFVQEVLKDRLNAKLVIVGHDFHFGHGRKGNVELLSTMGESLGFDVIGLDLKADDEAKEPISSTRIRKLIAEGDVAGAALLLGRPFSVRGKVVEGDNRGTSLGYPTANLSVSNESLLPSDGVYAGWFVDNNGTKHAAAINLGKRPTFYEDAKESLLEAFLLDFNGDLYGHEVELQFLERLRDELKFDTAEALIDQIERDVQRTRDLTTI